MTKPTSKEVAIMNFQVKLSQYARENFRDETVEVVDIAVFVRNNTDQLYRLYLPYQYANTISPCRPDERVHKREYTLFNGLFCVCTNIEEFQYYQRNGETMFLIKVALENNKGFWTCIFPSYHSFLLTAKLNKKRYDALAKIYYTGNSSKAIVLDEFFYLPHKKYMVSIDNKFYLISANEYPDEGTSISEFDVVEPTPHLGSLHFIGKNKEGEAIFNSNPSPVLGPCASIQRMDESDFPRYNEHFDAYWAKDEKGNILGMYINSDYNCNYKMLSHLFFYAVHFSKPATEVKFLMRTNVSQREDEDWPDYMIEIWGLTFETEKWLFIQTTGKRDSYRDLWLDYSKLIF